MQISHKFRLLEAATNRLISGGHSMKDHHEDLEKHVWGLEREITHLKSQLGALGQFVVTNFPEVMEDYYTHEKSAAGAALRLLEELLEHRRALPPHGVEQ